MDEIIYVVLDHGIDGMAKPSIVYVTDVRAEADAYIENKGKWKGCFSLSKQVYDGTQVRENIHVSRVEEFFLNRDGWINR